MIVWRSAADAVLITELQNSNAGLRADKDRLLADIDRLQADNKRLRDDIAALGRTVTTALRKPVTGGRTAPYLPPALAAQVDWERAGMVPPEDTEHKRG